MIEKKELENRIDQIVSPVMNTQTPGMVLLAARGKDILLHKAYGMADLQRGIPITTKSQFAIASNTKQFTCFALMMLKDRGLLHYDDAIADFFPDFPAYRHRVTIRHLMNHCSGIPEYIESPSWLAWEKAACADTAELLDFISALDDLEFEPGSRFSYCNSGYVMLGNIIEQLTYMPFGKFLEKEIFLPAGMHCACAPDSAAERGDALTEGYEINHGKSIRQPYDMALIGYADGNIQATACDMLAWHRFLYEKKGFPLVSPKTLAEAFSTQEKTDTEDRTYGFGLIKSGSGARREIWHGGGTMGFTSRCSRYIEENLSIIMLSNMHGLPQDELYSQIASEIFAALI